MSLEVQKKVDDMCTAFEEFKKSNDERLKQLEEKGSVDPILKEMAEKASEDVGAIHKEVQDLKVALNRPRFDQKDAEEKKWDVYQKMRPQMPGLFTKEGQLDVEAVKSYEGAFERYLRKGEPGLNETEKKALSVGSDPDGGFFVRPEVSERIIEKIFESSPVRQVAAVQQISSDSLEIYVDYDEAGSGWVGEQGSRTETDTPEINMKKIFAHEMYAMPVATQRILDDAGIDVEQWLSGKVDRKFMRTEASAFVNGNGVEKPRGFLQYSNGTTFDTVEQFTATASSSASLDNADDLVELAMKLKQAYRANASWMMERATLSDVRQIKQDSKYVWQPGLQAGVPSTIFGRPVFEADDMPSVGSNALAVVIADFREFYQIVDRIGIRVLRDPYTSKGKIKLYTTKRVGGAVANAEAGKILKLKA